MANGKKSQQRNMNRKEKGQERWEDEYVEMKKGKTACKEEK